MWVRSLGREGSLEKGVVTHSSIVAWRIPWTGEPGGLQSMGSQRVRYDWAHTHLKHCKSAILKKLKIKFQQILKSIPFRLSRKYEQVTLCLWPGYWMNLTGMGELLTRMSPTESWDVNPGSSIGKHWVTNGPFDNSLSCSKGLGPPKGVRGAPLTRRECPLWVLTFSGDSPSFWPGKYNHPTRPGRGTIPMCWAANRE